jgi:hypothetical protein
LFDRRAGIMRADGLLENQWRNSASADGDACGSFFELTQRAARIAQRG